MKKSCLILSCIICMTIMLNCVTAAADNDDDGILTLEEAKEIALKNDVQFNLQQSNIKKASENYEKVYNNNTKTDKSNYKSVVDSVSAMVSRKINIENAASNVRKAIFERNNLKRTIDYDVTDKYYGVLKAKYSLMDAEADMKLKKEELEKAKIKYEMDIITKNALSQTESTYDSSVTAYNKAFTSLQNSAAELSKSIGKNIDIFNVKFDMALNVPDISSIDLNKIKVDYMKNSPSFYSAKEQYDLAEYKMQLIEEQYDIFYKRHPKASKIIDDFNEILNDARNEFDDVKYSYRQKEKELDLTLQNQYTGINDLYKSYKDQKKKIEDTKLEIEQNRIKYQMGLIKKADLDNSIASLQKLENQLNSTVISLNLQYLSLTQYSTQE